MATAIYYHPTRTSLDWHRRMVDSIGLDFLPTQSVGEMLKQMATKPVPLVLLTSGGGYELADVVFPIKARHGDARIVILSAMHAPDQLPDDVHAWICVADHEDIVRSRLKGSIEQ
ncbi:MAG TPA: hypothetical protein VGL89_11695 [Candidatus Koribacter sp.]|jgi:hypothetical protein